MPAMASESSRPRRITATPREGEQVRPLELFFDLVFVLAMTQCTALMAKEGSWESVAQGLLVLGVLWWAWVGYAWLTSVIDPEEGAVRLVIFGAMAAMLICALCVPEAFDSLGLAFAVAYGIFRGAHIALFVLASPDDPGLRRGVIRLAASAAVGVTLLASASFFDGLPQGALWALALLLDMGGVWLIDPEGWRLAPHHFAERHSLIVIIALGESIVAIGVGAAGTLTLGMGTVAVLGVALAAAQWWIYFDLVSLVSARRLIDAEPGRIQNALARDSYSYLHLLLIAGIVLGALGLKESIAHYDEHLHAPVAFALWGGVALYLLGLVALRWRHVRTLNRQRLLLALVLLIGVPVATALPALASVAIVVALIWAMIAYEHHGYDERRERLRHEAYGAHAEAH
jgi:low temperature requirement protein LtrA